MAKADCNTPLGLGILGLGGAGVNMLPSFQPAALMSLSRLPLTATKPSLPASKMIFPAWIPIAM